MQTRVDAENAVNNLYPSEKDVLSDVKKAILEHTPTLEKVLKANLSSKDKRHLVELYNILVTLDNPSRAYIQLRDEIAEMLKVHENMSPEQLTYYSKEEQRLTQQNKTGTAKPTRYDILDKEAPDTVKTRLLQMYDRLQTFDEDTSQYAALHSKLKWALSLPYDKITTPLLDAGDRVAINAYCAQIKKKLDAKIYGLIQVKEEMLETVVNRITNPGYKNANIALKGPPGVGKTVICQALADALELPFERISLGGLKDSSLLKGNDNVWVGAEPSIILKALTRMGSANGIILFDEIDKLSETPGGFEVQSALLHVTDPSQNSEFKDDFISEFPHDISKIIFLFAMNDDTMLSAPLRDRLHIIEIPAYSFEDKLKILSEHLLPNALENLGLKRTDVVLTDAGARAVLAKAAGARVSGVRLLDQIITKIVSRLNFLHRVTLPDGSTGELNPSFMVPCQFPFSLNAAHVDKLWVNKAFNQCPPDFMYT